MFQSCVHRSLYLMYLLGFRLLELILEDKCPIEKHDYNAFFVSLSSTSSGVTALTSFLRNHFTTIIDHVDNGKNMVFTIYSILSSKVSTDQEITKV